jgi:hypothetical protein
MRSKTNLALLAIILPAALNACIGTEKDSACDACAAAVIVKLVPEGDAAGYSVAALSPSRSGPPVVEGSMSDSVFKVFGDTGAYVLKIVRGGQDTLSPLAVEVGSVLENGCRVNNTLHLKVEVKPDGSGGFVPAIASSSAKPGC